MFFLTKILALFTFFLFLGSDLLLSQTPQYLPGFPKVLDIHRIPLEIEALLIVDLNRNGNKEIIIPTYDNQAYPPSMLYVVNYDGSNLNNFPKAYSQQIFSTASGDVNGDGYLDIVLRLKDSIDVLDRFGNHLPGFPIYCSLGNGQNIPLMRFISLYDLDNDGKLEILTSTTGKLYAFGYNGTVKPGFPISFTGELQNYTAVGDLDGDDYPEIIFTSYKHLENPPYVDSGAIYIYKHDGTKFSNNWPIYFDSNYTVFYGSPTVYIDKNNPSLSNILITSDRDYDSANYWINRITKYDIYGNIINREFQFTLGGLGSVIMGDINKDGFIEYCTGEGNSWMEDFAVRSNNLQMVNGWPQIGCNEIIRQPIIGKFKYGNELNILTIPVFYDTMSLSPILGYNYDGTQLSWSPLREINNTYCIIAGDVNNDGNIELVATSQSNFTYSYLHIWTFQGINYTNNDFPWPMYCHDRYRTNQYGFIPPDEPIGIKPISSEVPKKFELFQNYPNPFNSSTVINYQLPVSNNIKLVIFDVLGREVATLVNEKQQPGKYQIAWDATNLASGVYFYKLFEIGGDGDYQQIRKMVIIK